MCAFCFPRHNPYTAMRLFRTHRDHNRNLHRDHHRNHHRDSRSIPRTPAPALLTITVCALLLALVSGASCSHHEATRDVVPRDQLKILNRTIKAADVYVHDRTKKLDSIALKCKAAPAASESRWKYACELSQNYLTARADSALDYADLAVQTSQAYAAVHPGEQAERMQFIAHTARINALSTAGIFTQAQNELERLESEGIPESLKPEYWNACKKLYAYMRIYVETDPEFYNDYTAKYFQYDDSLQQSLPNDDPMRKFYLAERLIYHGQYERALDILNNLCDKSEEDDNIYGMSMYQLAIIYRHKGDSRAYATCLIKASISDIKGAVSDGLALPLLADWLYSQGELQDAFSYINFAMRNAMSGNVRMRTVTIASMLPVIDDSYRERMNASRDELMNYFLLVTVLLIISVILLACMFRLIKRNRLSSRKLKETTRLQQSYIGHFIGLCSNYANRLQSLQKLVMRKLATGQTDELQKMIKSGKFALDQNDEFYEVFDSAFLNIYPEFVAEINALLKPEERIELKSGDALTPELRIYALVKIGVDESTRISQILNYSVSTIYTYRNRMRNRALDRTNFDKNVAAHQES